ncbi:MAG TPA: hypothetical protein VFJ82_06160 [Longimicrobium sp.]|nr:hypothetical protein [Longimicrobium sp.]
MTWKRGEWPSERSGRSSATTRSKGISWWSCAPSTVSRTRPTSARKEGSPARSVRSTRRLTKRPTSSSTSGWVRPATGVPTTTSSLAA